jgi:hypothetical protein
MLRIIWLRWLAYSNKSCERGLGRDIQLAANHVTTVNGFSYPQLIKLGGKPITRPQGTSSIPITCPIMPAQVPTIINLTIEGSQEVKCFDRPKQDK